MKETPMNVGYAVSEVAAVEGEEPWVELEAHPPAEGPARESPAPDAGQNPSAADYRSHSWGRRIAVALLAVLAALGFRLALTPLLGTASPFLMFVPAVMLAAWFGGLWPGLFAAILSSALGTHYLLAQVPRPGLEEWDRVVLFLVVCAIIVWVQVRVAAAAERVSASLARERAARREAQAATRAKEEFLAMVSHELRTPANTVLGWISLLKAQRDQPAFLDKGLEVIERNVSLQARLLQDIVDNLRAARGTMRLQRQAIDLTSVVAAAVDAARPAANAQDVRLEQKLQGHEIPIFGDAIRLQQVMTNLISNALKFTPPGGSIVVRLEQAGEQAKVSVRDTGIGIDESFLPFVFERFRRGNHAREGLGLGLAISRHLVEMHGGTIEASSAGPERGSTFTVMLPIRGNRQM